MNLAGEEELLRNLIDRLNQGDEQAFRDLFETYRPVLRMVVRRRLSAPLRSKLDSEDVVQSVWADLLDVFREGGDRFADANRLEAFLVRAARNRLVDRQRQYHLPVQLERPAAEPDHEAAASPWPERPSEAVQADELWEQILASCPPVHRELLVMKREGRSLAEMAERSHLHPSSIRRIFYELAGKLGVEKAGSTSETRPQV